MLYIPLPEDLHSTVVIRNHPNGKNACMDDRPDFSRAYFDVQQIMIPHLFCNSSLFIRVEVAVMWELISRRLTVSLDRMSRRMPCDLEKPWAEQQWLLPRSRCTAGFGLLGIA